jgi:hypothetical protein
VGSHHLRRIESGLQIALRYPLGFVASGWWDLWSLKRCGEGVYEALDAAVALEDGHEFAPAFDLEAFDRKSAAARG